MCVRVSAIALPCRRAMSRYGRYGKRCNMQSDETTRVRIDGDIFTETTPPTSDKPIVYAPCCQEGGAVVMGSLSQADSELAASARDVQVHAVKAEACHRGRQAGRLSPKQH